MKYLGPQIDSMSRLADQEVVRNIIFCQKVTYASHLIRQTFKIVGGFEKQALHRIVDQAGDDDIVCDIVLSKLQEFGLGLLYGELVAVVISLQKQQHTYNDINFDSLLYHTEW